MSFRPSFKPYVKDLFPTEPHENICHVLSWQYMNTVMDNLIQELPENEEELKLWGEELSKFIYSICLTEDTSEDDQFLLAREIEDDAAFQYRYATVANAIRNHVQVTKQEIINHVSLYYSADDFSQCNRINNAILKLSWELLEFLNSMPTNLKIGDASWNKSIGGAVDPRSWDLHDDAIIVINNSSTTENDDWRETNGRTFTLEHAVDQEQLMWAFAINDKYVNPVTYLYTGIYQDNSGNSYCTVCSSSNSDSLVNFDWKTEQIPVYSFDRSQNGLVLRY